MTYRFTFRVTDGYGWYLHTVIAQDEGQARDKAFDDCGEYVTLELVEQFV